jgi:hypothetical protein
MLMGGRLGELARDEVEMKRCWEEIWGVLVKERVVEDGAKE